MWLRREEASSVSRPAHPVCCSDSLFTCWQPGPSQAGPREPLVLSPLEPPWHQHQSQPTAYSIVQSSWHPFCLLGDSGFGVFSFQFHYDNLGSDCEGLLFAFTVELLAFLICPYLKKDVKSSSSSATLVYMFSSQEVAMVLRLVTTTLEHPQLIED